MTNAPALFWFRNDLRLSDNPGLTAAVENGRDAICVYILEANTDTIRPMGGASLWWLDKSLRALAEAIEGVGGRLILRCGDPRDIIPALVEETGADTVCWNRRYGAAERDLDAELKSRLKDAGITAQSHPGNVLAEPWTIETGQGGPYRVYSPFWRSLKSSYTSPAVQPQPKQLSSATGIASDSIEEWSLHPTTPDWSEGLGQMWTPGEAGAKERLSTFLDEAANIYADQRNRPDIAATSFLSPHLHFGEIGVHAIWRATVSAMDSGEVKDKPGWKFLSEIAWRDFANHLLFHYPDIPTANYKSQFDAFPWRNDGDALAAWQRGQTGYPIVDAGMRELWETGWMHNRVRMIVASFLTKHLLIHWGEGEKWFWDTLVDADDANNAASWQWVAGSGADAAPYFRIFNPITQGEKFDPKGDYIRKWVPELAKLPDACLNAPWEAPALVLRQAGVELGRTYPKPIVDHKDARQRALDAYETIKG